MQYDLLINVGSLNVLCIDTTIISLADACAVTSENIMASTSSNCGSCDASGLTRKSNAKSPVWKLTVK